MIPRIEGERPAAPLEWGDIAPGRERHHIIPYRLLRDVWNCLVDPQNATNPETGSATHQFLALSDRRIPDLTSLITRIRAENTGQPRGGPRPLEPLNYAEALRLETAAVWPAWNVVEGPKNRSDDPGDHFIDRFTAGLTAEETARMTMIEVYFGHLQAFLRNGPAASADSLRALADAARRYRPLYCERPIPFRPEMWVRLADGTWRKKRRDD